MTSTELLQVLTGCLGSLGFAILFNVRGKRLWFAALGGLLSWLLYLILGRFINSDPISYFIVSLVLSVYAEVMARVFKTPTTTFITISLIPLVPGGSLYYTMAYAFQNDAGRFFEKGVYTLQLAAALALGIIVATAFAELLHKFLRRSPV